MADMETIHRTADAIGCALNVTANLDVRDNEEFVRGITVGIKIAAHSKGEHLTASEMLDNSNLEDGWYREPDFVLGALIGTLIVNSDFEEVERGANV